jgi:hypothetical protein
MAAAFSAVPQGWFDVRHYGAAGDGATDDTAAIQSTIDACAAAAGGTVYFPPAIYFVNGAFGGANGENAQLRFPKRAYGTDPAVTIRLVGAGGGGQNLWGLTDLPAPTGGSILKTTKTGGGNLFGVAAGGGGVSFSALTIGFEDFTVLTYDDPDVTVFDLRAAGNAWLRNVTVLPARPSHATIPQPTHTGQYAVRMPSTDNSAVCWVDNVQVYNHYTALEIGECFQGVGQFFAYACQRGVVCTPMNHGASFSNLTTSKCPKGLVGPGSGSARLHVHSWRYEYVTTTWAAEVYAVDDAGNRLKGSANICPVQGGVGADTHAVKNGGTNFTLTAV